MPSGIILLDKPLGLSSNSALQKVRRAFGAAKAGHVGTLDPLATGMLPICLDEATKVIADIETGRKAYRFVVSFGTRTTTGDAEGETIERRALPAAVDAATLEPVLARFRGPIRQVPPMYSAIKREGQPLYKRARVGEVVEREARMVTLFELDAVSVSAHSGEFVCECSKGTYIRVLAEDLARALGSCGHVTSLRRIWVEPFKDAPMHALETVLAAAAADDGGVRLPADRALAAMPALSVAAAESVRFRGGQTVSSADARVDSRSLPLGARVRVYGPKQAFLGIGEIVPGGLLQPRRVLLDV